MATSTVFWNRGLGAKGFRCHDGAVMSLDLSPDGTALLSGGEDGMVRMWHADHGGMLWCFNLRKELFTRTGQLPPPPYVTHVEWSQSGKRFLACCGEQVFVFGSTGQSILRRFVNQPGQVYTARWISRHDGYIMTVCRHDRHVRVWRATTDKLVERPTPRVFATVVADPCCLAVTPDGREVFVGGAGGGELHVHGSDQYVGLVHRINGCDAAVWNHECDRVFAGDRYGYVYEFYGSGEMAGHLASAPVRLHQDGVMCMARPRGSRLIVSGDEGGTAKVWHEGLGLLNELEGHAGSVRSVAAPTQFETAFTGGEDGTIRKWSNLDVSPGLRRARQALGQLPPDPPAATDLTPGERHLDL